MKRLNVIVPSIFLAAVDQIVKLIVSFFYMDRKFTITSWLGFSPHLNTEQMSILNNEFNLDVDHSILIIIGMALPVLLFCIFASIEKQHGSIKLLRAAFVMMAAGSICFLMDLMFWGGSLDYMLLFSYIIDLKDVYLFAGGTMFFVFCMGMAVKEHKEKKKAGDTAG